MLKNVSLFAHNYQLPPAVGCVRLPFMNCILNLVTVMNLVQCWVAALQGWEGWWRSMAVLAVILRALGESQHSEASPPAKLSPE